MTLAGITALMSRSLAEQPTQRRKMAREDSHSAQQRDQQTGNSEIDRPIFPHFSGVVMWTS
jgi:hypothetical protein